MNSEDLDLKFINELGFLAEIDMIAVGEI